MVLIDTVHMTIIQPRLEFPSPYGDYGSYQYRVLDEYIDSWYGFPSPCGDYGSYHALTFDYWKKHEDLFPSPCGDYGSYLLQIQDERRNRNCVSVPLRGLWFLSYKKEGVTMRKEQYSFRPLTGIMVLIRTLYRWLY